MLGVLIVSFEIFIYEFISVFLADPPMNPNLGFQIREYALNGIVGIWKPCFRMVIEVPKQWHVSFYAQICTT